MKNGALNVSLVCLLAACGSSPPPKADEPVKEDSHAQGSGPKLRMSQELGSIDQRKVEQTFANLLQGPLEACHRQGRDRVELLAGDVKVFLRIDEAGHVRYGFFEDTTLGDRETEKCILGAFRSASWPKPDGGEAEVRNGFGWTSGGEREPTTWSSDKVATALVASKDVRRDIDKCKAGVKGDFRVTAYVEEEETRESYAPVEIDGSSSQALESVRAPSDAKAKPAAKPAPKPAKPAAKPSAKKGPKDPAGRFKAIGIAPPDKDAAEKVDCIVDALRPLELPSPGSYPAKVTFTL